MLFYRLLILVKGTRSAQMYLALLTSTLQALVFTVLSTIYFLLMLPHDDHGHEEEAQHAH